MIKKDKMSEERRKQEHFKAREKRKKRFVFLILFLWNGTLKEDTKNNRLLFVWNLDHGSMLFDSTTQTLIIAQPSAKCSIPGKKAGETT